MRSSIASSKQSRALNRRSLALAAGVLILAVLLLLLDMRGLLMPVKGIAQAVLQPTEQRLTQSRLGLGQFFNDLLHFGSLRRQNADLQAQLAAAQAKLIQLQTNQARTDALERELGIRQAYGWVTIPAHVVQGTADNGRRMIRIGKGRVDGVTIGMAVIGKEGGSPPALIGTVDRVYAQTSDVLLITDGAFSIGARTTAATPVMGLIVGQWQAGSRTRLDDVDRDALLVADDVIVSAGLSKPIASDTPLAQVPAGVPIGTVTRLLKADNQGKSAEVQPFVDPDRVLDVWVITGEQTK